MKKFLLFVTVCMILFSSIQVFAQESPQYFITTISQGDSRDYVVTGILKMFNVRFTGVLFGKCVVAVYYDGQPYKDYLLSVGQIVDETEYEPAIYCYSTSTIQIYSADIEREKRLITDHLYIPFATR